MHTKQGKISLMSRTIEQIRDILHGSQRWNAGLQWYDFLLAIEFRQDGTGEMMYGEGQALRSDIKFRYEISADLQIQFEFFDTIDAFWGKMFERTEENAFKTVAFHLLDGPFVINEPYHQQHSYRYLLRFSADPFPHDEGSSDKSLLDYYGWVRE
jgi:putative transposase